MNGVDSFSSTLHPFQNKIHSPVKDEIHSLALWLWNTAPVCSLPKCVPGCVPNTLCKSRLCDHLGKLWVKDCGLKICLQSVVGGSRCHQGIGLHQRQMAELLWGTRSSIWNMTNDDDDQTFKPPGFIVLSACARGCSSLCGFVCLHVFECVACVYRCETNCNWTEVFGFFVSFNKIVNIGHSIEY